MKHTKDKYYYQMKNEQESVIERVRYAVSLTISIVALAISIIALCK